MQNLLSRTCLSAFVGAMSCMAAALPASAAGACQWEYSPSGKGAFQALAIGPAFKGLRFGDFDGDGKTDVFAATSLGNGAYQWKYSSGGTTNFQNLAVGPAVANIRFGDFDGDGKTGFQNLAIGPALTQIAFGDFNGDWVTDVFTTTCN
jgi:hypothetical protein